MDTDVLRKSITKNNYTVDNPNRGLHWLLVSSGLGHTGVPAYWSPLRDAYLRNVVYSEYHDFWAGAVGIAITKMASLGWDIEGTQPRIRNYFQQLYLDSDGNQSWVSFIAKHLQDFLCTDNGAFVEIVRASSAAGSRILGLIHLDSLRCTRTGDAETPIIYRDLIGYEHEVKAHQVMMLADMPNPAASLHGVGFCVHGDVTVSMEDGTKRAIKDLVKSQSTERVMSLGADGTLSPKRIIGWHANPMGDRTWVNIRCRTAYHRELKIPIRPPRNDLWVTNDHPILTLDGYRPAGNLASGDQVVTSHPAPNAKQAEVLLGTLLGDGCIAHNGGMNPRISMAQKSDHVQWLALKVDALSGFGWRVTREKAHTNFGAADMVRAQSVVSPSLVAWHKQCYPNGKKQISPELLNNNLSPLLMTCWYLDDGWIENRETNQRNRRPTAQIAHSGDAPENTEALVQVLNRRGFECRAIQTSHGGNGKDIHFSANGSVALFEYISTYVPECMRYKLPINAQSFDEKLWNIGAAERFVDKVDITTRTPRKDHPHSTVYCLDVEDNHNFVASNIVVHNCATSRAWTAIRKFEAIEQYHYEKITGDRALALDLVHGIAPQEIKNAVEYAREDRQIQNSRKAAETGNASPEGAFLYKGSVVVPILSDVPLAHVRINFAELPDGFNYTEHFDKSVLQMANALGLDVQDLQPLTGRALGTGTQSQVLDEKSKGKGLAAWRQQWTHLNNQLILPDTVTFAFNEKDLRDKMQEAQVFNAEAQAVSTAITSGAITSQQGTQILADNDFIPAEFVAVDTTPQEAISDTEKPQAEAQAQSEASPQAEPVPPETTTKELQARFFALVDKFEKAMQP